jgi:glycosyltransferase involved in cell wall biosynthesis
MKVLFIAPLPPPITGHSLASKIFYDELLNKHEVKTINLSKNSFKGGIDSLSRIKDVIIILCKTLFNSYNSDRIYLTISESFAGNIKDLLIYLICFSKLNKFYIHLHGGSIKNLLFNRNPIIFKINKFFIKRLAGVIVLGESHISTFSDFVPLNKIHIVPNFSEDNLFLSEFEIAEKNSNLSKIHILFLSNMQVEKGFQELFEAFLQLDFQYKDKITIDFAGKFENIDDEIKFRKNICEYSNINFHGVVKGEEKRRLLRNAQIFVLPTSFLEGQPVSILEAYASGCFVFSTISGGIVDIFVNNVNGYEIEQSPKSIKENIIKLFNNMHLVKEVGIYNRNYALKHFRTDIYNKRLIGILES